MIAKLFQTEIVVTLNLPIILGGISLLIAFILFRKWRPKTKPNYLIKSRFGFLGKQVYSLAGMLMLAGTFYLGVNNLSSDKLVDVGADKRIEITTKFEIVEKQANVASVGISLTPQINGEEWGNDSPINIFWVINGPTEIRFVELDRESTKKSGFMRSLAYGDYEATIIIVLDGEPYEYKQKFTISK